MFLFEQFHNPDGKPFLVFLIQYLMIQHGPQIVARLKFDAILWRMSFRNVPELLDMVFMPISRLIRNILYNRLRGISCDSCPFQLLQERTKLSMMIRRQSRRSYHSAKLRDHAEYAAPSVMSFPMSALPPLTTTATVRPGCFILPASSAAIPTAPPPSMT